MYRRLRMFFVLTTCFALGAGAGAYVMTKRGEVAAKPEADAPAAAAIDGEPHVTLATDRLDTIVVPSEIMGRLGIRVSTVEAVSQAQPLRMPGSLMLDANRLVRVHSRFEGHVVSLGTYKEPGKPDRVLQFGDSVAKNQVLAKIWSKEIGQKKSELLDAYSQFNLNQATLDRLKSLRPSDVSEHVLRDAQRSFEGSLIAVQNAERTLRSWQLSEADTQAIRDEADRLHAEGASRPADAALRTGWAELEVRSPTEGVILEKNVTIGELVDAGLDLFKIADVRQLMVVANAYEEDLPAIMALPPEGRRWQIFLNAEPDAPPIDGEFDLAGRIIDPVQHTAQLVGWVENPNGRYMAGQFISALVPVLPPKDRVFVPTNSVIDTGDGGVLYVASGDRPREFSRRKVAVAERGRAFLHLRSRLSDEERAAGYSVVRPHEKVVSSGVVLLENSWKELSMAQRARQADIASQNDADALEQSTP